MFLNNFFIKIISGILLSAVIEGGLKDKNSFIDFFK